MPRPKKEKPTTPKGKLEEKLRKTNPEVVDLINEAGEQELRARLCQLAQHENETIDAKDEDEELQQVSAQKTELEAPYKETLKGIKLQRGLIAYRIEELGKA